jgi:hypothetical protein
MDVLHPLPPEFDDVFLRKFEQYYTTQVGATRYGPFAPPAVPLYAAICQSAPFQDCQEDHIWGETQYTSKRQFLAQNRPRLICTLFMALSEAEAVMRVSEARPQEIPVRTLDALGHLQAMCDLFVQLREARNLSKVAQSRTAYTRNDTLQKALATVRRVVLALTPEDYTYFNHPGSYSLFARMRAAFDAYGPTDKRFNQTAKDYAIASILIHCGRETGDTRTVVNRLQAREKRASKPAQD